MKILHEAEYICECDFWNDEPMFCPTQELVRCKDCKHMIEHKGYGYLGESAYTCESNMDGWILPDSYCSMAERKDNETD